MKKLLLSVLIAGGACIGNAQTTLFEDGFETYQDFIIQNIGQWMLVDGDQLSTYIGGIDNPPPGSPKPWPNAYEPMACQIFNPSVAGVQNGHDGENSNFNPHGGQKYAAFWAGVPEGGVTGNNDWLISPKITLGNSANELSFWVKSLATDYGLEKYKVAIYVGEGNPTSTSQFTVISGATPVSAPAAWTKVTYNLDAYKNQPIRFAINYVSKDVYMMMVDDVKVTTGALGVAEASAKKGVSVYPNPSRDVFHIRADKKVAKAEVYSADGRKVQEATSTEVDLSGKPKGVYTLKLIYSDGTSAQQQIIRK